MGEGVAVGEEEIDEFGEEGAVVAEEDALGHGGVLGFKF